MKINGVFMHNCGSGLRKRSGKGEVKMIYRFARAFSGCMRVQFIQAHFFERCVLRAAFVFLFFPCVSSAMTKNVLYFVPGAAFSAVKTGKVIVNQAGSFSLSTWVKVLPEKIKSGTMAPIMSQSGDTIYMYRLYYNKDTNEFVFLRRTGWTAPESDYTRAAAVTNEWCHLAAVYDSEAQERRIYINGVLAAADPDTFNKAPVREFTIGYEAWVHFFYGYVAEMSIWNYALDESKIAAIMNARPAGEDMAGCIAYWPFDEGNGGVNCRDISNEGEPCSATIPDASKTILLQVDDFPEFDIGASVISYSVNIHAPDGVVVTEETEPDDGTRYSEGSVAVFSASSDTYEFVRWYGDVPSDQVSNRTVSVTVSKDSYLAPYFKVPWSYDDAAKTISDGYWTLGVSRSDDEITVSSVKEQSVCGMLNFALPVDGGNLSVVKLASRSFYKNTGVEEVTLPDGLRVIDGDWWDAGAFYSCTSLKSVTPFLPDSVNCVGMAAFDGCTSLEGSLFLGQREGVQFRINQYNHSSHFADTKITSADLGKGVTNLPYNVFGGCSVLEEVILRGEVQSVGKYAFQKCTSLRDIFFYGGPPDLNADSFLGCGSGSIRLMVPRGSAGWEALMADPQMMTPWSELGEDTKALFYTNFPGEKTPAGLSASGFANVSVWISVWDPYSSFPVLIVR